MITPTSTTLATVSAVALAVLCPASGEGGDAVDASAFDYDASAPLNIVEGEAIDVPFPGTVHPITYDSPGGRSKIGAISSQPDALNAAPKRLTGSARAHMALRGRASPLCKAVSASRWRRRPRPRG